MCGGGGSSERETGRCVDEKTGPIIERSCVVGKDSSANPVGYNLIIKGYSAGPMGPNLSGTSVSLDD